ncbi:YSIRK-targeted triacylglycerol lipase [Staphylococcus coagulans]|uniref:YSIRK-targeted triacylglycerol lipase n=1 Tax=Staphylococcus coagulans TaxID=74706 RepID=UPI002929399D|nr:YSIRK-type signal peptide-containing protein [Staphylococcus coagulans]MDU9293603.1 YSIRK-type signal peptide-containing protein [Staphylococcus coagulans]
MENNQGNKRYIIRKYSIGVVSVLAATTFFVSTHEAQAAEQVTNGNHAPAAVVQKGEQLTPNDVNGVTKKEIPAENLQPATYHDSDQQINVKLTDLTRLNAVKPEVQSTPELTLVEQQNHTNTNQNHINKVADASHATSLTDRQSNKEIPLTPIELSKNTKPDTTATDKNTEVNDNHSGNDDNATNGVTNKNNDPQHATSSNQAPRALLQVKDKTNSDITAQNQDQRTAGSVAPKANDVNHHNGKAKQPATHIDNKNENKAKAVTQSQPVARTATPASVAGAQKPHAPQVGQAQHVNKYPIVLVHGFLGLVDQNAFPLYPNYWGGNKFKVVDELRDKGYDIYQASVGAFGSNYDRAVELYYYIKGGRVDYGAAHAAKYGHERYGRTYEGIMRDWQPGKKIHLIGHSMGGQTIRLMEQFLRNGNQEEIAYYKQHGGEISPLFLGGQDNMIASITTLGTPHNGSQAADKIGNKDIVRNIMYALNRLAGNKNSTVDFGLRQWGFQQQPGETRLEYINRVSNSRIWTTTDNAAYDLTLEGAAKLNEMTSLNPNITYTTYTGLASHTGPLGNETPSIGQFPLMDLTSRIIGHDANIAWRKNDGIVPVISSLHPFNQAFIDITAEDSGTRKGIWQVRPILQGWDHVDFIGIDATDLKHTGAELANFYMGIVNHLLGVEAIETHASERYQS